jgi:hypothetical protein
MTSTPSAGTVVLEVEASAANAAAPPPECGPRMEEAWTRDFVRRIACAKFLDAAEPWTAVARRAMRSPEGGGRAAAAAGVEEAERLWW